MKSNNNDKNSGKDLGVVTSVLGVIQLCAVII